MGGDKLKNFRTNFITSQGKKRELCPVCIYRDGEFVMQKDEVTKLMVCENCGYSVASHMKPVQDTQLEAGNQADTSTPYLKTVSFPRNRKVKQTDDTFNNPMDAWNSDA